MRNVRRRSVAVNHDHIPLRHNGPFSYKSGVDSIFDPWFATCGMKNEEVGLLIAVTIDPVLGFCKR